MDKIVGKICVVLVWLTCSVAYASIRIQTSDLNGIPIKQIGTGQPFSLDVVIEGVSSNQLRPEIKGLENSYWRNNGIMITTINGRTTIKQKYRVRFDSPGFFVLGPAKVNDNGNLIVSNTVGMTVSDQPAQQQQVQLKNQEHAHTGAFLKLTANKDHVVLGETITCSVRFYYGNDVTNLAPINQQEIPGFTILDNNHAQRGVETINGKQYNYLDLQWSMCPTQVGKKMIPAYFADFTVRSRGHHQMPHLSMFLSTFGEQKRVYSNALTISVDPLPPITNPVHAIGNFTSFTSRIEPGVAKEGEGMVLTLELEGTGNLNNNVLGITLPSSFKYYDSKNYPADQQNHTNKYCFEFIVQGFEKGDWEIPAQTFTFFDTATRAYKNLQTVPLTISILPSLHSGQKFIMPLPKAKQDVTTAIETTDEIQPLSHTGVWYKTDERSIPIWLFVLLLFLPMSAILWPKIHSISNKDGRKQRNAFKYTHEQLQAAKKSHNVKLLYTIFIDLFAHKYQVAQSAVTQEFMQEKLQQAQMSAQEIEQWNTFINQLSEYVFFAKQSKIGDYQAMHQYSQHWINILEKIL